MSKPIAALLVIKFNIAATDKVGTIVFESDYSDSSEKLYNTILVQGEMPDENLKIEIWVKQKFLFLDKNDKYNSVKLKRFQNGRFWAKFKLKEPSQNPIKIAVINLGVKTNHTVIIYDIEVFQEDSLKPKLIKKNLRK